MHLRDSFRMISLKKGIVWLVWIMILFSCLVPSIVHASVIYAEGVTRGRGFIYLENPEIGYFRFRVRRRINNHNVPRIHGSFEFKIIKESIKNPSLTLKSVEFESFQIEQEDNNLLKATITGMATVEIHSTQYRVTYTATLTDGDLANKPDHFEIEIEYEDASSRAREKYGGNVIGKIIIKL